MLEVVGTLAESAEVDEIGAGHWWSRLLSVVNVIIHCVKVVVRFVKVVGVSGGGCRWWRPSVVDVVVEVIVVGMSIEKGS